MQDILDFINSKIREEHGRPVTIDDKLVDSEVDSFGITMVLLALDEEYHRFDPEWLKDTNIAELTVNEIVDRIANGTN